jgi:stage V sporulation protein G
MPSRKLTDRCAQCGCKNHLRARFCNQCGHKLNEDRAVRDPDGRAKLHADIAHPINSACREVIQTAVLKAYKEEKERSKQPGYVCSYDDFENDYDVNSFTQVIGELNSATRTNGSDNFRSHPAHGPRGAHAGRHTNGQESASPVTAGEEDRPQDFGAGIM